MRLFFSNSHIKKATKPKRPKAPRVKFDIKPTIEVKPPSDELGVFEQLQEGASYLGNLVADFLKLLAENDVLAFS